MTVAERPPFIVSPGEQPRVAAAVARPMTRAAVLATPVNAISPTHTPDKAYAAAKRAFDLIIAGMALLLLAPMLALIALAIIAERTGPVLYRQPRVGRDGRLFTMWKFRTMQPDLTDERRPTARTSRRVVKRKDDPRVTEVGRVLRRTSLDELPQLVNILRGEMSLVGPCPELPELVAFYGPEHWQRHLAVPGLIGWWQVNGRCRRRGDVRLTDDLRRKLADDLYYLEHRSFWFDLRIVLRTVLVVLAGHGAF